MKSAPGLRGLYPRPERRGFTPLLVRNASIRPGNPIKTANESHGYTVNSFDRPRRRVNPRFCGEGKRQDFSLFNVASIRRTRKLCKTQVPGRVYHRTFGTGTAERRPFSFEVAQILQRFPIRLQLLSVGINTRKVYQRRRPTSPCFQCLRTFSLSTEPQGTDTTEIIYGEEHQIRGNRRSPFKKPGVVINKLRAVGARRFEHQLTDRYRLRPQRHRQPFFRHHASQ